MSRVLAGFLPPPKYTVSEWADANRKLSAESSAIPGQWRTSLVEYMREPMDCVGDPRVTRVVVMAAAQVAKSEFLNNVVGYLIDYDPSPILMVQPTIEAAEDYSKDRIAPMIRDTPVLREKVADDKSKTSGNTIKNKKFPGGYLVMIGANSPSGLASRPIRAVLGDEVDRAPVSAGQEGDPINLAIKRTATFWNRIVVLVSTPTNKGASRIETAYEEGDQRQRWCPCPECGEHQTLKWSGVRWDKEKRGETEVSKPDTARYMCEHCGVLWTDPQRVAAVRKGYWRASAEFNGVASFHVTGLLSPFASMADGVREFLAAQGDPAQLKVWVNTYLGESWEEEGKRLDAHELMERTEEYDNRIPDGVTILTAGVDVQEDRIECEIVGWGDDFESWSVDYSIFYGDPSNDDVWSQLTTHLRQIFRHPRFGDMQVRATCIDTGYQTHRVYQYVRSTDRVWGIKGVPGEGKPFVGTPTRNNYGRIHLFPVGVHTAKGVVFSRLAAKLGDVGYCHFPADRKQEYFDQLTAETLVTRYHKGYKRTEYVKTRSRNEALDNRVYASAALELINVDLVAQRRACELRYRKEVEAQDETKPSKPNRKGRGDSFVDSWRGH